MPPEIVIFYPVGSAVFNYYTITNPHVLSYYTIVQL